MLISCDSGLNSSGVVVDKKTRLPIDSVTINVKNLYSVYTDSMGKYKIDTTIYGHVVYLEILLSKQGYKTKHVDFKNDKIKKSNAIIEMEILEDSTEEFCFDLKQVSQMYYFNKYFISLINILTLFFLILKKRVKWKLIWILGVFIFNFTIFISFVDCSIMDFKPINGPIFLTHYWHYPFSIKIVFPIASIAFWSAYLINKRLLLKPEE
jgi:hypothetical protein